MDKPFWDETYKNDAVTTFGVKPNRAVETMWKTFDIGCSILDVGCGEGKNPIFLAEKGFKNIDAFDISQAGIEKLKRIAQSKNLQVNSWVEDLTTYIFSKTYDVIVSYGTLHFVEKDKWHKFISGRAGALTFTDSCKMTLILKDINTVQLNRTFHEI